VESSIDEQVCFLFSCFQNVQFLHFVVLILNIFSSCVLLFPFSIFTDTVNVLKYSVIQVWLPEIILTGFIWSSSVCPSKWHDKYFKLRHDHFFKPSYLLPVAEACVKHLIFLSVLFNDAINC
jgi:hypothetical protein